MVSCQDQNIWNCDIVEELIDYSQSSSRARPAYSTDDWVISQLARGGSESTANNPTRVPEQSDSQHVHLLLVLASAVSASRSLLQVRSFIHVCFTIFQYIHSCS